MARPVMDGLDLAQWEVVQNICPREQDDGNTEMCKDHFTALFLVLQAFIVCWLDDVGF